MTASDAPATLDRQESDSAEPERHAAEPPRSTSSSTPSTCRWMAKWKSSRPWASKGSPGGFS